MISRPALAMVLYSGVYLGLLLILAGAVPQNNQGVLWAVWLLSALVCLSATAMELTLLLIWLGLRVTGTLRQEPYVALNLTPTARQRLAAKATGVAMLMPAHSEVSNLEDAEAFVQRIVDLVRLTPEYAHAFLLFDSPSEQHQNEVAVFQAIRSRLSRESSDSDSDRVHMETYRQKPATMKNKPGSIHLWLMKYAPVFEYMFVLDADSSLLPENPRQPETCDVLARLVFALEQHPELAMVQAAIRVHTESTVWGWFQSTGVGMAAEYHGLIFQWLLEGTVPSYGHNVLFRVSDFVKYVSNTLQYLSHDFLDASDLASSGRRCIQTYNVVTCEEGEASLLGYLKRDLRWARGNAQWANYLYSKPNLPTGSKIFLWIGIFCYVWPLIASIFLVASVLLLHADYPLINASSRWGPPILLLLVGVSLFLPKALASRELTAFTGSLLVGVLMAPSLMMLQGIFFVLGAFGTKWTVRGTRSARLDLGHAGGILRLFAPIALIGLMLWGLLPNGEAHGVGAVFIQTHLILLILSPLFALLFSCPLPRELLHREDGSLT